jgi:hypothetical protein
MMDALAFGEGVFPFRTPISFTLLSAVKVTNPKKTIHDINIGTTANNRMMGNRFR